MTFRRHLFQKELPTVAVRAFEASAVKGFRRCLFSKQGECKMNRIAKIFAGGFLALVLLALGSYTLASAAENESAGAPQAAASAAAPTQSMGRGMMGWGMPGPHSQMHGAPAQVPCPCAQNPAQMGPGMMGHPVPPGMMGRQMGPGMMGGGMGVTQNMDPKTRGKMMQLRGKQMIEMGEMMEKRGKELEAGK
jgi:hypothetical protein